MNSRGSFPVHSIITAQPGPANDRSGILLPDFSVYSHIQEPDMLKIIYVYIQRASLYSDTACSFSGTTALGRRHSPVHRKYF
jgi:hypothetical protein